MTAGFRKYERLDRLLEDAPFQFQFFQAVRLLAQLSPEREAVGLDGRPEDEVVRFASHISLGFPASELQALQRPEQGPPRLIVNFFGLAGPSGALPVHYTELILARMRQKDTALRDFLALFDHRLISLFFRAGEKYRFYLGYERAEIVGQKIEGPARQVFLTRTRPAHDLFSQCLLDLSGLGTSHVRYVGQSDRDLHPRLTISEETWRYFAGLLAQRRRSAAGLQGMLADYFNVEVEVIQFVGQWILLDPASQTSLVPGGNIELGRTAVAGVRVPDVQSKFRVRIGPLSHRSFAEFLPGGSAHQSLVELIEFYAGKHYDVEVQLVLKRQEVPPCELSSQPGAGVRLGWETWAANDPFAEDVDSTIFNLTA